MDNAFDKNIVEPYFYSCANTITSVNKEFLDLTGYFIDELIGKPLNKIEQLLKINSQIYLNDIITNYCGYIFTKSLDVIEVSISKLFDCEINETKYTFIEIENSNLTSKLLFVEQTFVDNISGAAIYSVPDLILLKSNQKYLDFTCLRYSKPENSLGRPISEIITGFTGSQSEIICNKVLETQKSSYFKDLEFKHLNTDTTYLDSTQTPIFENGEMKYIYHTAIDVTTEINSNLVMEKALKLQGEFLVNISHELKTPLNVIFATVQLFNRFCNNGSLDDQKDSIIKYVECIKQNSYRLSKMINNIVDLSKIEAGFFNLYLSNNNIVEFVEHIVMSVTNFTDSKGLNIIFDTDVEEKIIACDPEKLERVILNLLSNAIKFTDNGGEIFVDIKDKNKFIEISVTDNGIGIEPKNLDMIFDRFKQIDKSLERNSEGTGIGLNLVKSIVELHGGNISVESEFGKGSKFIVKIPSRTVSTEDTLYTKKVKNADQSIRVELSGICS
ncbi:MAG: ATP-binding protein [Clostridium sp.]|uniref:sensor histidine kinase n=1 Tax=Clostridium sp. TaxID=1506 RepID=UPI003D6D9BE3